jgi:DNA replication protein DnaC
MQKLTVQTVTDRMEELGLLFMAAGFESYLAEKSRDDIPLVDAIADLIELEYIPRKERMAKTRLKVSGLPQVTRLEEFDLSWPKGGLTEKKFQELSRLSFLPRKENVILMGPSGIGKTHLMIALAYKACMTGYTAYYLSCMDLIEVLVRARAMNRLKRKLQWMKKPHVLVIDEVGYENLNPEQATLFFQLINVRYEHGSIIITTNKPFSKWGEMMSDDAVATATLDRLLHHAHVVSLKGDSYRMKDRLKVGVIDFE